MTEEQARRELPRAMKARRRVQAFAMVLLGVIAVGSLVIAGVSYAQQGQFSGEQLLPVIYGGIWYAVWRLFGRPPDTSGELVACRVVQPYGVGGRGLRIRRPDGALLAAALSDDKSAVLNAGDEVWFVAPQEGRRLVGVAWNHFLQRSEPVVSVSRARLVVPPGAVPSVFAVPVGAGAGARGELGGVAGEARAASELGAGPQDVPLGVARRPQVLLPQAIRPLGPPPPPAPDGIDEDQARAALADAGDPRLVGAAIGAGLALGVGTSPDGAARHRRRRRVDTPPDVPLEIVTIESVPRSAYAPPRDDITVRCRGGERFTWPVALEHWPADGTTCWATPVAAEQSVRLVVPTPAGDVLVVEPHAPAVAAPPGSPPGHPARSRAPERRG